MSTASSPEEAVHKCILNAQEETVTVDGVKPDDWLKVMLLTLWFVVIMTIIVYAFLSCHKIITVTAVMVRADRVAERTPSNFLACRRN